MRNFFIFQQAINLNIASHIIKDYIRILGNTSIKHMFNQISDFFMLKQFGFSTRLNKVLSKIGWIKVKY